MRQQIILLLSWIPCKQPSRIKQIWNGCILGRMPVTLPASWRVQILQLPHNPTRMRARVWCWWKGGCIPRRGFLWSKVLPRWAIELPIWPLFFYPQLIVRSQNRLLMIQASVAGRQRSGNWRRLSLTSLTEHMGVEMTAMARMRFWERAPVPYLVLLQCLQPPNQVQLVVKLITLSRYHWAKYWLRRGIIWSPTEDGNGALIGSLVFILLLLIATLLLLIGWFWKKTQVKYF